MTFDEYSALPNKLWWQVTNQGYFDAGAASRDVEVADLKVVSDHNLATYHQAAELLRAEIADLRRAGLEWHGKFITETAATELLRDQVRLLRDALEKIADNHGSYGPFPEANNPLWGSMAIVTAREALATTADLSGVILCDAETIGYRYELKAGEYTFSEKRYADEMYASRMTPLYRAWEPK